MAVWGSCVPAGVLVGLSRWGIMMMLAATAPPVSISTPLPLTSDYLVPMAVYSGLRVGMVLAATAPPVAASNNFET